MGIKVANNAFATLASGITNSATSITLTTGQGARFPSLGAGDYFYATLIDTSNNLEIVKCTARSTDVLTVVRAQESTTARAYSAGDRIEIRLTAATFTDATQALPTQTGNAGKYLTTDGTNASWGTISSVTPASISDQANSSTGYFDLPAGTTAQRPGSPGAGMVRFNTTTGVPEWYDPVAGIWLGFYQNTNYSVEYLVIAGGGGGGRDNYSQERGAGGGGAGGYRSSVTGESSGGGGALESVLPLISGSSYTVTIGAGGTGGLSSPDTTVGVSGTDGGNSVFGSITSLGGGGGGGHGSSFSVIGRPGGSAGGGGNGQGAALGTTGQGYNGGRTDLAGNPPFEGSGGGGAGAVGGNSTGSSSGGGGAGVTSSITGSAVTRAGGGGGRGATGGSSGGSGGGGAGTFTGVGGSGTVNTGGGGGGARQAVPGNGGSGVVIIRYLGAQRGTGGTVTTAGGYTVHTFTSSGTYVA